MSENAGVRSLKEKYQLTNEEVASILAECGISCKTENREHYSCVPGYNDYSDHGDHSDGDLYSDHSDSWGFF